MDAYHVVHGHDVCSFDVSHIHRQPTISASQAIEELNAQQPISTGVPTIDELFGSAAIEPTGEDGGGVMKGEVTEIWGPPGVGKTSFGLQLAARSIQDHGGVVWIDALHQVCAPRLTAVLGNAPVPIKEGDGGSSTSSTSGGGGHCETETRTFTQYSCSTLAHFIALTCRATPACIPRGTALIVIDSLSALINHAFPRSLDLRKGVNGPHNNDKHNPGPSARRLRVIQYIAVALRKLAAMTGAAIVVLTQCATRIQSLSDGGGATLIPAINAVSWDTAIATRLVLFRDWALSSHHGAGNSLSSVRFAAVQKQIYRVPSGTLDGAVPFTVTKTGIEAVEPNLTRTTLDFGGGTAYTPAMLKRKLTATGFGLVDGGVDDDDLDDGVSDEDYGWQDEDQMPAMPPQWQGSEDLIIGQGQASEDEGDQDAQEEVQEIPASDEDDELSDH